MDPAQWSSELDEDPTVRSVLFTGLLFCGCHAVPADLAGARGQQRFVAEDRSFAFEYLSPPWSVLSESTDQIELEVPPEFFGVTLEGTSPSHRLQIGHIEELEGLEQYTQSDEDGDTDGFETETETDGAPVPPELEGIADTLVGLDLRDPYVVARAELEALIDANDAQLDHGVSEFTMPTGVRAVEFQVQMSPGFFVRAFYVDARPTLVRAAFVSLFDLDTPDVAAMARTLDTVLEAP